MKNLKNINLGLVLAIITVILVIGYCIGVGQSRKKDKDIIKKQCEEFISLTDKYTVMPVDIEKNLKTTVAREIKLDEYEKNLEKELNEKMKNEKLAKNQKAQLVDNMKAQIMSPVMTKVEFKREIKKIKSYDFNNNQVTVKFDSKITSKIKDNTSEEETNNISQQNFEQKDESITLEKVNGTWKVVSADLRYNSYDQVKGVF